MESAAVTFITLFLSLTTGLQPVEVAVTGPVAAVEIRIDGETVDEMFGPPWRTECDFGSLRPLILEAIALDENGGERAVARQVVNLPRSAVESRIVLLRDERGLPVAARLISDSGRGLERVSYHVSFDGLPVEVVDPDHFDLPTFDENVLHFLSARVDYTEGVVSHAEVSFGGSWAGETRTDLTAVPLLRPKRGKRIDVDALQGCLLVDGDEAKAVAVEDAPANLVLVADRTAEDDLQHIQNRRLDMSGMTDAPSGLSRAGKIEHTLELMRNMKSSSPKLRLVSTTPEKTESSGRRIDLFPLSPPTLMSRDSVMLLLANPDVMPEVDGPQQLADAVAVAGLFAAGSAAPRGVLLVLGSDPDGAGRDTAENVRGYLESINVPLFVWKTSPPAPAGDWGETTAVTTSGKANGALRRLLEHLDRQVIVWIKGAHLPNQIELRPGLTGLEIAR